MDIVGYKGGRIWVNSAQAISRDRVDETFGALASADGSISQARVERELPADAIIGRVAIRELCARLYALATGQRAVTDERARQVLCGYSFGQWRGATWTAVQSLDAHVTSAVAARADGIEKRTGEKKGNE
jgi:hypothetical protein